jgi:CRISPR system Cascade subunit CasE
MHLSRLILNPRSRQVRSELSSPYQMHRTLMRAFPDASQGGPGRVLFRVDQMPRGNTPMLLVQSEKEPDWSWLRQNGDYTIPGEGGEPPWQCKPFEPSVAEGQHLAFRLRANPTVKRDGKRLGLLKEQEQAVWLERKARAGGFRVISCHIVPEGMVKDEKHTKQGTHPLSFYAVRYEGVLEVTDPDRFRETLAAGIGPAKGYGFGLLSVAPA